MSLQGLTPVGGGGYTVPWTLRLRSSCLLKACACLAFPWPWEGEGGEKKKRWRREDGPKKKNEEEKSLSLLENDRWDSKLPTLPVTPSARGRNKAKRNGYKVGIEEKKNKRVKGRPDRFLSPQLLFFHFVPFPGCIHEGACLSLLPFLLLGKKSREAPSVEACLHALLGTRGLTFYQSHIIGDEEGCCRVMI